MSDDRSATEVWQDWFASKGNTWFGLGDAGAGPFVQCEAAVSCDSPSGERQAFLFRTFDPDGWFMVLDSYDPDREMRSKVEWLGKCDGILDGVTQLAEWIGDVVPSLADISCPGMSPSDDLIARMAEAEGAGPMSEPSPERIPEDVVLPCGCHLTHKIEGGVKVFQIAPCRMDCPNLLNAIDEAERQSKPVTREVR